MATGNVSSRAAPVTAATPFGGGSNPQPGQTLVARVVEVLDNGSVRLATRDAFFEVKPTVPLPVGTRVLVQVEGTAQNLKLVMHLDPQTNAKGGQQHAGQPPATGSGQAAAGSGQAVVTGQAAPAAPTTVTPGGLNNMPAVQIATSVNSAVATQTTAAGTTTTPPGTPQQPLPGSPSAPNASSPTSTAAPAAPATGQASSGGGQPVPSTSAAGNPAGTGNVAGNPAISTGGNNTAPTALHGQSAASTSAPTANPVSASPTAGLQTTPASGGSFQTTVPGTSISTAYRQPAAPAPQGQASAATARTQSGQTVPSTGQAGATQQTAQTAPGQVIPSGTQTLGATTSAAPQDAARAALSQMVHTAIAGQDSPAPLFANLSSLAAMPDRPLPDTIMRAVEQLLGIRLSAGASLDAASIQKAVRQSGIFQEARLASPPAGTAIPADMKSSLLLLRSVLQSWLGTDPVTLKPSQERPPPPRKGALPTGQRPAMPTLLPSMTPPEIVRVLLAQTEAALERLRLSQFASRRDDGDMHSARAAGAHSEWTLEIPLALGQDTAIVQMLLEREQKKRFGRRRAKLALTLFHRHRTARTGACPDHLSWRRCRRHPLGGTGRDQAKTSPQRFGTARCLARRRARH